MFAPPLPLPTTNLELLNAVALLLPIPTLPTEPPELVE